MNEYEVPKVSAEIRHLLDKQYKARMKKPENKTKMYRCNRCKELHIEDHTVLRFIKRDSKRRHRLCVKCNIDQITRVR